MYVWFRLFDEKEQEKKKERKEERTEGNKEKVNKEKESLSSQEAQLSSKSDFNFPGFESCVQPSSIFQGTTNS